MPLIFQTKKIPGLIGRNYYKLLNSNPVNLTTFMLILLKNKNSALLYTSFTGFEEYRKILLELFNLNSNEEKILEYIVAVNNWMNDPTVKNEEKETIKDFAYKLLAENVKLCLDEDFGKPFLIGTIWGYNERFRRVGNGYKSYLIVPDEERIILDYFDKFTRCVYGNEFGDFRSRENEIDKDHLLMFDYAKAYLLYDLILSNRIEFSNVPSFVDEIKQRGKVRELKPAITTTTATDTEEE